MAPLGSAPPVVPPAPRGPDFYSHSPESNDGARPTGVCLLWYPLRHRLQRSSGDGLLLEASAVATSPEVRDGLCPGTPDGAIRLKERESIGKRRQIVYDECVQAIPVVRGGRGCGDSPRWRTR